MSDWFEVLANPSSWEFSRWTALSLTGQLLGLLHIPSVLLRRSQRPMAALSWILCLITLPYLGVVLWWMIGRTHLERKRRRRRHAMSTIGRSLASMRDELELPGPIEIDGDGVDLVHRRSVVLSDNELFPTTSNNHVKILVKGTQAFPAIETCVREAREHIHFQFYIWQKDVVGERFRDLLVAKAREGVEVRVLFDAVGSPGLGRFLAPLEEAGGHVAAFLPVRLFERRLRINFRNHRKIVIVDGDTGFTGGINIGEEYNEWYDLAFRFTGPVVNQLQEVFAEDWYFATGEELADPRYFMDVGAAVDFADDDDCEDVMARVLASGPDSFNSIIHTMFFLAITNARDRIFLTTPYFIPDQAIMMALKTAALRGVDVRLLLPGQSDIRIARIAGRSYFDELLEAGVRIFEYQPHILHAKILVFDDVWSIVGSANMDTRSFHLHFEANCALYSRRVNGRLVEQFLSHLEDSRELTAETFGRRSNFERLQEAAARLLSPLL